MRAYGRISNTVHIDLIKCYSYTQHAILSRPEYLPKPLSTLTPVRILTPKLVQVSVAHACVSQHLYTYMYIHTHITCTH